MFIAQKITFFLIEKGFLPGISSWNENQDDDGFVSWLITKEPLKTAYLIVANYNYPKENICPNENTWKEGL